MKHLITVLDELQALGIAFVGMAEGIDATTPGRRVADARSGSDCGVRAGTHPGACAGWSTARESAREAAWTAKEPSGEHRDTRRDRQGRREDVGRVEEHGCALDRKRASVSTSRLLGIDKTLNV
jgi:hypothetical protein